MSELLRGIRRRCGERGLEPPSRATVYKLMRTLPGAAVRKADLPAAVQSTLYNLAPESEVPLHHIAFHCFNYGGVPAICFGAGLPWLAIYQALRTRGHRPKSRGLLEAVALVRRI